MAGFDAYLKSIGNYLGFGSQNKGLDYNSNPSPNTLSSINAASGFNPNPQPAYSVPFKPTPLNPNYNPNPAPDNPLAAYIKQINEETARLRAQPRPLSVDYNSISNQARARAEASVNPLYAARFNDFVARQAVEAKRQQDDAAKNQALIDEALGNTLQANQIAGQRTSEDVATNLDTLANQEQNFQQQEGTGFEQNRAALQSGIAQAGLTGSGLGAQAEAAQIRQRNQQSGQVTQSFDVQKHAQQILQTRTFADLARSSEQAQKGAGRQKEQVSIDLNRFIEDQAYNKDVFQKQEEANKQLAIIQNQGTYEKELFRNFLDSIKNEGVKAATAQAYGGLYR